MTVGTLAPRRRLTTAAFKTSQPAPTSQSDDKYIKLQSTDDGVKVTRTQSVVDITDENSDVSGRVLSQKEFLEAKRTRFVTKEEYDKLKPHEVRNHVKATIKPADLEAKYGKKRAKKMIKRQMLTEHGKASWNPRDIVAESHIKEFSMDDVDIERRPKVEQFHFLNKSIYDMTEEEFYSSFFRDRERKFDGMGSKLRNLESQLLKEQQEALRSSPKTRIAPKAYWLKAGYVSPTPEEVAALNSLDLRFVMMNEARKSIATCNIDDKIWDAFLMRVNTIAPNVCIRSLLRFLQIVSKVQLTPTDHVRALVDHIHRRRAEMKPKHYVFLFQALGRLRLRDQRLYDDLYEMVLCWPVLRNNFLVKAANSLAKLGVCDSLLLQPLRDVLAKRIDFFSATDCTRLKAITILEMFADDMIPSFLEKCEYHRQHFRHYTRHLEVIELYIRLFKAEVYGRLDDATKQFLIDVRQQTLAKKLADATSTSMVTDECNSAVSDDEDDDRLDHDASQMSGSAAGGSSTAARAVRCPYHEDVSRVLTLLGVPHRNYMRAGPFILDVYEPKSNTVIEINTEHQYYHGTTHLTAMARRRHELIAGMGFRLLHIPYRWWRQLQGDEAKASALREHLCLVS
ncbi:RAP domain-containing protein, putative [Babesia ovata]|uniref:RAP domain-containing protein, putative n=1 Tax=Babesia ovata TaxID=189622 RepID=A0A2H6KG18_9APIC|nr:RAP domain-containing protein, putative [Babesia ovata]GBE61943.1 RAP domain-containing protein, putative [Babesia ovata]